MIASDLRQLIRGRLRRRQLHREGYRPDIWMHPVDGECIERECKGKSYFFESGTGNGYSTCWAMAGLADTARIVTYDIKNRPKIWEKLELRPNHTLVAHIEPFKSVVRNLPPESSAVYLIDGDHKYESVMEDWNAIEPFLQEEDIVLFHDINNIKDVRRAWDSLSGYKTELDDSTYGMGILSLHFGDSSV